jgi:hypothetical protein
LPPCPSDRLPQAKSPDAARPPSPLSAKTEFILTLITLFTLFTTILVIFFFFNAESTTRALSVSSSS